MAKTSLVDLAMWGALGYVAYKYVLPKLHLGQSSASIGAPPASTSGLPLNGVALDPVTGWYVVMWHGQPIRYTPNKAEADSVYNDTVAGHGLPT